MNLGLSKKFALITGGSNGIGKAIALRLAKEGCNVGFCARDKIRLNKTLDEIKYYNPSAISISANLVKSDAVNYVFEKMISKFGQIDILINNFGGGGQKIEGNIQDMADSIWQNTYYKNAFTTVKFTMLSIPYMKNNNWGRVVTISSINGKEGGGRPWYTMAKSAQISLMKTLSMKKEYSQHNITFNSIAPGAIKTSGNQWERMEKEHPQDLKQIISWKHPIGRLGTPNEVASVVAFVSSTHASLINGACISVDGGESKSF